MENASKALIMAAEILLGVMLISIGVYLFNMFGNYSRETTSKIEDAQLAQFNNQFLKYYGERTNDDGNVVAIECTIHDIASLVNLAKKNNEEYDLTVKEDNNFYIQIEIDTADVKEENLEKLGNSDLVNLIKENDIVEGYDALGMIVANTKYYKCEICHINETTKRVDYMLFTDY